MTINILNQMIQDNAKVAPIEEYARKKVVLLEPQCPDSIVTIRGIPDDSITIKIDSFSAPDNLLSGRNGECKRADYAIISNDKGRGRILVIEMKKTNAQHNHLVEQFKGAKCAIEYCKEVAKEFYNCSDLLKNYSFRYISFCRTNIRKRKTRIHATEERCDKPHLFWKIDFPNDIEFKHLAGA